MINLNAEFIADATRSHVERDPRNQIGARVVDELAMALEGSSNICSNRTKAQILPGARKTLNLLYDEIAQFRHCK